MRRKTGTGTNLAVKNVCCLMSSTAFVRAWADRVQLNVTSDSLVRVTVSSPANEHNAAVQHSNQDDWHSTPEPCTALRPEAADHSTA